MVIFYTEKPHEPLVLLVTALANHSTNLRYTGDVPTDTCQSDEFRMYEFKIRRCPFGRGNHEWTDCPYLHPGEKARRRDPRKYFYSSKPCGEFRKHGQCENGDSCQYAHGVFEAWLHPEKYKTQLCRDGLSCRRKVCFFAHFVGELRGDFVVSPKSVFVAASSPPWSPVKDVGVKMGGLKLSKGDDEPDIEWVSELVD